MYIYSVSNNLNNKTLTAKTPSLFLYSTNNNKIVIGTQILSASQALIDTTDTVKIRTEPSLIATITRDML
jgi:hypothetical protein